MVLAALLRTLSVFAVFAEKPYDSHLYERTLQQTQQRKTALAQKRALGVVLLLANPYSN
jgi:hypothetical protein